MKAAPPRDELYLAHTEIRHLKNTIGALRVQLEEIQNGRDDAVHAATAASRNEVLQLRKTIEALRDELQTTVTAKEAAVQSVAVAGQNEGRRT